MKTVSITQAAVTVLPGVAGTSTSSLWVQFSDAPSLTLAFSALIMLFPV